MKLLSGEFTFRDVCISVSVYEREREKGNYSSILGEAGQRFIRLSRVV